MADAESTHPWAPMVTKNGVAVAGSVLVHLMVFYGLGWLMLWQISELPPGGGAAQNEVVVMLEEILPELLEAAGPEERRYIETYQNQESAEAPENAAFESDRDTRAMAERLADGPAEEAMPTVDGEEKIPFVELQDHRFVDGPDGEIPRSVPAEEGMPVAAMKNLRLPEQVSEEPVLEAMQPTLVSPEKTETMDPEAMEVVRETADADTPDAKPEEVVEGDPGGSPEVMELAKVDDAAMRRSFADALDLQEFRPEAMEDVEDRMPERRPDPVDPTTPFFQMRQPSPSAPLVATPLTTPKPPAMPLQPGIRPQPATEGMADEAAFSPERRQNKMNGSVSNIGRSSAVDAEATPMGRYKKEVSRAVERRWHMLRMQNESFVTFGSLKLRFTIDARGEVQSLNVLHDDATAIVKDFSLAAIMTAEIPPMPEEIINLLGNEPLEVTYDIIIY